MNTCAECGFGDAPSARDDVDGDGDGAASADDDGDGGGVCLAPPAHVAGSATAWCVDGTCPPALCGTFETHETTAARWLESLLLAIGLSLFFSEPASILLKVGGSKDSVAHKSAPLNHQK